MSLRIREEPKINFNIKIIKMKKQEITSYQHNGDSTDKPTTRILWWLIGVFVVGVLGGLLLAWWLWG